MFRWFAGLSLLFAAGSMSYGQTMPSPAEQMLNAMLRPGASTAAPATQPDALAQLEPDGFKPPPATPQLLREGSSVISRAGHLKKNADGPYPTFVFDSKKGEAPIAPMFVLPNLQRMSMEDAASATQADLRFTVSGTVTEYKGKNYILLEPGPDEARSQMAAPGGSGNSARGPMPAEQMLSAMLNADGPPDVPPAPDSKPHTDVTSGDGAVPPKAPVLTVLPEQSQIFDRVCRLNPSGEGDQEELTLDSDGAALQDPPLLTLPNLKLMDLERAAGDHHDTRFRITGVITEYRGRNYILLQKVVVMADAERQF
jgi:hypothetical protein